ncbi:Transmembrane 9 superfamily member 7 [Porphyridium purpureum]|uniref:Transmembrane 9 superfamily member n=1 Tax=Porphyridium purpureum TaxID=35688 RepID=A0A5J4Z5Z2_PORPP|nr:Transmembrane 9 superfamily member 7 [Porphyridium purpureum]|eukprot:POR0822..scf295_1
MCRKRFGVGLPALVLALALVLLLASTVRALYVPGVPTDYEEGAPIEIVASKLTSNRNKVPYAYYSVAQCVPADVPVQRDGSPRALTHVSLGQILLGEREHPTAYNVHMMVNEDCAVLCEKNMTATELRTMAKRIQERYHVRMSLDQMPLVSELTPQSNLFGPRLTQGIPLGQTLNIGKTTTLEMIQHTHRRPSSPGQGSPGPGSAEAAEYDLGKERTLVLFNHLMFTVLVNTPQISLSDSLSVSDKMFRVVGFRARPMSIDYSVDNPTLDPQKAKDMCLKYSETSSVGATAAAPVPFFALDRTRPFQTVLYTYSVKFEPSDLSWATRWDPILKVSRNQHDLQLMALGNSLLLGLLLTGALALVLLRTLRKDLKRYADHDEADEALFETGWKLVGGDVFRPPQNWPVLAIACATGVQIAIVAVAALVMCVLGFLSVVHRGALLTALLFMFPISSIVAGFVIARMVKLFGASTWKGLALGTSLAYPGFVFIVFLFTNVLLWLRGSISVTPFFTILLLLFVWLGISCPLVFVGAKLGFPSDAQTRFPSRVNQVPRQIPQQSGMMGAPLYLIAGGMPFGVVCVELLFVLNSIWQNEYYLMFGMLLLVYAVLLVTAAETSISVVYLKLILEDYRWWWPSFLSSASSGLYVFLYGVYYLINLGQGQYFFVSTVLYLCYMAVISITFALIVGAVGTGASLAFVTSIYAAVRTD